MLVGRLECEIGDIYMILEDDPCDILVKTGAVKGDGSAPHFSPGSPPNIISFLLPLFVPMSSTPSEKIVEYHTLQRKFFESTKTRSVEWRKDQLRKIVSFCTECGTVIADALTKDLG